MHVKNLCKLTYLVVKGVNQFSTWSGYKASISLYRLKHTKWITLNILTYANSCDNPFTPTDNLSSSKNNERKSPLKLLSVERVNTGQALSNVYP